MSSSRSRAKVITKNTTMIAANSPMSELCRRRWSRVADGRRRDAMTARLQALETVKSAPIAGPMFWLARRLAGTRPKMAAGR